MGNNARVMIAATGSGNGKTLITCGILQELVNRGLHPTSFKCGPDYIDPMFHSRVIGARSRNLDLFLCRPETVRYLLAKNSADSEIAVLEGVMGYYDGMSANSTRASAYDVARTTGTPVILLVNGKGMSLSMVPIIKGFLEYRQDSMIRGVILNQISPMLYPRMKEQIEAELPVKVLGYVPTLTDCVLDSRHLGLVMPDEIADLQEKLQAVAKVLEESLEWDRLLELAGTASELPDEEEKIGNQTDRIADRADRIASPEEKRTNLDCRKAETTAVRKKVRIGLARDEAFCFMYEDNLVLLRELGAELVEFSPIHDRRLPENLSGLLLYGGYPELYAKQLSENREMCEEIREKIESGMPVIAECGGFMYLHDLMEGMDGVTYPMAGVIHGRAYRTDRLRRFGYITLTSNGGSVFGQEVGEIRAHEFHYFDSDQCGDSFYAQKPDGKRGWACMIGNERMLAGFPHLHYYGNPKVAEAFLEAGKKFF